MVAGCQQQPKPPHASNEDIEAAQHKAEQEVADARMEAAKDVKSAAKTMGADSRGVKDAKVTATYDVAMAKADGDHTIATEKCLTLPADQQPACTTHADADYDAAKAAAKATRLARQQ